MVIASPGREEVPYGEGEGGVQSCWPDGLRWWLWSMGRDHGLAAMVGSGPHGSL